MKKIMLFIFIMMFVFVANVNAANNVVLPGQDEYNTYQSNYNKGVQPVTINTTGMVTLYGYSSCQPGVCTYKYSNTSPDFKEVLAQTVKCSNGEKYISYYSSGGADGFKNSNTANHEGDAYWSEDYSVTCSNTQSSNSVQIQQTVNNGGSGSDYGSSSNVQQDSYGVETYYVILVIVGIITYLLTIVIKKQNLFKKV